MSVDKLVDSTQLDADLTSVANAIRTKGGTSASLAFPADFVQAIADIPSGGGGGNIDEIIERTATTISSNATDIKIAIGRNNTHLQSVSFPEATKITEGYTFQGCSALVSIYMPKLSEQNSYAPFQNCTSLEYVVFPSFIRTGANSTFDGCIKLKAADFGNVTLSPTGNVFSQNHFNKCSMLATVILRYPVVAKLGSVNNFNQSPFASGGSGGTIYIPKVLYDHLGDGTSLDYKAATNWSTINGYGTITWAQIEGSIYETQYADGTPIT